MRFTFLALVCVTLLASGCAMSDSATTTITETAEGVVTTFTGAAVQRDIAYMDRGKYRDEMTKKMHENEGVKLEFKEVSLADGSMAYLPSKIEVRAPHTWQQNIETRPPDHRGWTTLDKGLDVVTFGLAGYFLNDFAKAAVSGASTQYHGDYNYNPQTAEPYIMEPYVVE